MGWKGVATSNYLSRDSLITNSSNYIQQVYMKQQAVRLKILGRKLSKFYSLIYAEETRMLRLIRFSCSSTEWLLVGGKMLEQHEGSHYPPPPQSKIYVGNFITDGRKPKLS